MAPFARELGYDGPPFAWDEDRRALLRAELDAWYARAYGLSRDELRYILDPADVMGPDYPSETFRVLKNNEIRRWANTAPSASCSPPGMREKRVRPPPNNCAGGPAAIRQRSSLFTGRAVSPSIAGRCHESYL